MPKTRVNASLSAGTGSKLNRLDGPSFTVHLRARGLHKVPKLKHGQELFRPMPRTKVEQYTLTVH